MGAMKHFAEAVSVEMGLEGEITDEVLERAQMLLHVEPTAEGPYDQFKELYFSPTDLANGGTYALYRDLEGWDHQVTSVSREEDGAYQRMYPDARRVGRGYFVRGNLFATTDPREYGHMRDDA